MYKRYINRQACPLDPVKGTRVGSARGLLLLLRLLLLSAESWPAVLCLPAGSAGRVLYKTRLYTLLVAGGGLALTPAVIQESKIPAAVW